MFGAPNGPRAASCALVLVACGLTAHAQSGFEQAEAFPGGLTPYPCLQNPMDGSCLFDYTPEEVTLGNSHPAQRLSIFLPDEPASAPPLGYPVILYFPAAAFGRVPQPGTDRIFLLEALDRGWAVVTVGTVGVDSTPVGEGVIQPVRCCPLAGGTCIPDEVPANATPCRDYNLYYPPGTPEWDDFNVYYGEKDAVWARQHIAMNATAYSLDDSRVFVAGTSSGAHYAAFLAFHDDLSWAAEPGSQSTMDTRVDGLLAFEPVSWFEGPFTQDANLLGTHWPKADTSGMAPGQYQRARVPGEVATTVLADASSSTWARNAPDVPVFIASGNGVDTALTRDANTPDYALDFCRVGTPTSACPDPLQTWTGAPVMDFTFTDGDPFTEVEMLLHSAWHAIVLKQDLLGSDPVYHAEHSRLYLREDTRWDFLPDAYNKNGPGEITGWQDVDYFVDGEYCDNCFWDDACVGPSPDSCDSIDNERLAAIAMDWVAAEGCEGITASVTWRNAGTNPDVYTAVPRVAGDHLLLTVDLSPTAPAPAPSYAAAQPLGLDTAIPPIFLAGGQALLVFDGGNGELLFLDAKLKDGSGTVQFSTPVPPLLLYCGLEIHSQVLLFGGMTPYALTNALDLVVGYF